MKTGSNTAAFSLFASAAARATRLAVYELISGDVL